MFINYLLATAEKLPEPGPYLYEYIVAGNGIFVRAKRPGLEAMIPILGCGQSTINGLADLQPYVNLHARVPRKLLEGAILRSFEALPNEALFWYSLNPSNKVWTVVMPKQVRSKYSVRPVDPHHPFGSTALIDLHSHNTMAAFWSSTDNKDETGFRIYAVLGKISSDTPAIRVRVGIYGHFWEVPADQVFDLPPFLRNSSPVLDGKNGGGREGALIQELGNDYDYEP